MRLTLRTMLAYLDDILEPSDAQELGRKIEESKFAGDLVHRVRSSITRLRLAAPKLEGRGMGLDPNTVAEYLDNTLPADRVPDFEKVCLESDVHLAEVASCHQILTLVLGEPADVPPHARERIYRLAALDVPASGDASAAATTLAAGSNAVAAATGTAAPPIENGRESAHAEAENVEADSVPAPPVQESLVEPPVADDEPVEKVKRAKPEVPDYLRATRRPRLWPAALALLLSFGLVVSFLWITGGFNPDNPIAQMFRSSSGNAQNTDGDSDAKSDGEPTPVAASGDNDDASKSDGEAADDVPPPAVRSPAGGAARPVSPDATVRLPGDDVVNPVTPGSTRPTEPPAEPPVPADGGTTPEPERGGAPAPLPMPPVEPMPEGPEDATPLRTGDPLADTIPVTPPPTAGATSKVGLDVGRFISDDQVLSIERAADTTWMRLPTGATLSTGDRLLALPTYRPQLALAPGMQVTLSGPAMVQLGAPVGESTPQMQIDYGRAVIATTGRAGERIGLQLPGRAGIAAFTTADAVLAVEVANYLPPGVSPEAADGEPSPTLTVTRMYVPRGRVEWEEGGSSMAINAGQVRLLAGDMPGRNALAPEMPDWVSPPSSADPDRLASRTLESFLKTDVPIRLTLNELLEDRRVEVRSLSVRCLAYLGQYEPFVNELNDAFQKSYWDDSFDALRDAVRRSPAAAAEVRLALEKQRGPEDGAKLYRMLWGYSPVQLATGEAEQLVGNLAHERMDFRVLAFENLRRITGKTLLYRPEHTERKNQSTVQRWREMQKNGEIVYETAPSPLPELESGDAPTAGARVTTPRPTTPPAPASPLEEPMKPVAPGTPF